MKAVVALVVACVLLFATLSASAKHAESGISGAFPDEDWGYVTVRESAHMVSIGIRSFLLLLRLQSVMVMVPDRDRQLDICERLRRLVCVFPCLPFISPFILSSNLRSNPSSFCGIYSSSGGSTVPLPMLPTNLLSSGSRVCIFTIFVQVAASLVLLLSSFPLSSRTFCISFLHYLPLLIRDHPASSILNRWTRRQFHWFRKLLGDRTP